MILITRYILTFSRIFVPCTSWYESNIQRSMVFQLCAVMSTKSEAKRALLYKARFVYFLTDVWKLEPLTLTMY